MDGAIQETGQETGDNALARLLAAPADRGRRRGRPTLDEVAAISRQILDAANEVFQDRPFGDVSIEAIAERAGVERNTIYKRFPDKRGVLRAVLARQVASWSVETLPSVPTGDLATRLKAHATQMLRKAMSSEVRTWTDLAEVAWPGLDELGYRREVFGYDRMVKVLRGELEAAKLQEASGISHPQFVATALMSILTGWMDTVGRCEDLPDEEITAFAISAVDLVMHGCVGE